MGVIWPLIWIMQCSDVVLVCIFYYCFSWNATTPWIVCEMKTPSRGNGTDAWIRSDLRNHEAGAGYSTAPAQPQKYLPVASPDNCTLKGSEKVLRGMARLQKLLEQWIQLPGTNNICVCTWSLETRSIPSFSPPATMKFWSEQNSAQTREESFQLKKLH